ncbi:M23 family metallopeptidase [Streptomyces sp. NPDC002790]|uniref:M23 family metallopeptidase n=1 Tax=Streptomyces sp. NPDC002790 TaxID=3154431 RepID=UPI0033332B77
MASHDHSTPAADTTRRRVLGLSTALIGGALTTCLAPDATAHSPVPAGLGAAGTGAQSAGSDHRLMGPPRTAAMPLRRRYRVSARYGVRGNWQAGHHTGIDLAVPQGTPVFAVRAGTVVLAKRSGDYGKAVTIRMSDGRYAVYGHLSKIRTRKGARVTPGMRIADSGSTGRATGPHLHLEIRARRGYGSDVNPVTYLAKHGVRLT